MMGKALEGEHYCKDHQGNHSHYDKHNCIVCKQAEEITRLRAELEQAALPNEQGTNRYGLDVAYFRNAINRELNRPLVDFKPDELARVFARLSRAADSSVMHEPEFAPAPAKVPEATLPEEAHDRAQEAFGGDYPEFNEDEANGFADGWNACIKAMLKSQGGE